MTQMTTVSGSSMTEAWAVGASEATDHVLPSTIATASGVHWSRRLSIGTILRCEQSRHGPGVLTRTERTEDLRTTSGIIIPGRLNDNADAPLQGERPQQL